MPIPEDALAVLENELLNFTDEGLERLKQDLQKGELTPAKTSCGIIWQLCPLSYRNGSPGSTSNADCNGEGMNAFTDWWDNEAHDTEGPKELLKVVEEHLVQRSAQEASIEAEAALDEKDYPNP